MTAAESKALKKGSRVYWRGDAADGGSITEMSWDAVTIAWDNGQGGQSTLWGYARNPASAGKAGYCVDTVFARLNVRFCLPRPPTPLNQPFRFSKRKVMCATFRRSGSS